MYKSLRFILMIQVKTQKKKKKRTQHFLMRYIYYETVPTDQMLLEIWHYATIVSERQCFVLLLQHTL